MISNSEKQTKGMAKKISNRLGEYRVIALYGDLGSGKTNFAQGLAKELGIERRILSPTFVFVRSYPVNFKNFKVFHHVDLYRAESMENAKAIGIEEILRDENSLVAIEWPEIIAKLLPEKTLHLHFQKLSDSRREIIYSL